jgi:hypothetical protein
MTVLKNIVQATGLVVGVPSLFAHGLNVNGLAISPDLVVPADPGGYTVTADATNITITRGSGAAAVNIYVERWHSYERALPLPGQLAGLIPFVFDGGSGSPAAKQVFRYTASGVEGSVFDVMLPTVRATLNYNVQVTLMTQTGGQLTFNAPVAGLQLDRFSLVCSAAPAANDVIAFTVEELT